MDFPACTPPRQIHVHAQKPEVHTHMRMRPPVMVVKGMCDDAVHQRRKKPQAADAGP